MAAVASMSPIIDPSDHVLVRQQIAVGPHARKDRQRPAAQRLKGRIAEGFDIAADAHRDIGQAVIFGDQFVVLSSRGRQKLRLQARQR